MDEGNNVEQNSKPELKYLLLGVLASITQQPFIFQLPPLSIKPGSVRSQ
jgi:hypothetical protein